MPLTVDLSDPFPLEDEEQKNTYQELTKKLECSCSGALIRPSGLLPSGTVNIGDVIADMSSHLTNFTNSYAIILAILKMIACIIEVLCAMTNPFALIPAMIKLFGTCLPDFILIFPYFTIAAIILCVIKIILAIVEYILTVLVPVIADIIANIQNLISIFTEGNPDAVAGVAFKLAALVKELYNIIGILSALGALIDLIKQLLKLGLGIPCGGAGGSCSGCGDDQCPSTIKQSEINGTDGVLVVLVGSDGFNMTLFFSSAVSGSSFDQLGDFFPQGLDYSTMPIDEIPYTIDISGDTFAVSDISSSGTLTLQSIQNEQKEDGYLSYNVGAATLADPLVRFGTDTPTFTDSSFVGRYLELLEKRSSASAENTGTWRITTVYDAYNVQITRSPLTDSWDAYGTSGTPILDPNSHLLWRLTPAFPTAGFNKTFSLDINHEELIRRGIIGIGCHPSIGAQQTALEARFPNLDVLLPDMPDLDALITDLNSRIAAIGPEDIDSDYVLDNYGSMLTAAQNLDLATPLNDFSDDLIDYAKILCVRVFDPETTTITVDSEIQVIGRDINVQVTPLNRSGLILSADLPPGVMDIEVITDTGLSETPVELLDGYGVATGVFETQITSDVPGVVKISAQICDTDVSDFNGAILVKREVEVNFVLPDAAREREEEVSIEPLGKGSPK